MTKKQVFLAILLSFILFVVISIAFLFIYYLITNLNSNKSQPKKPEIVTNKISQNHNVEIDEPQEIDWRTFAPFYYWGKLDNKNLVLSKYTIDGQDITYNSVTKTIGEGLGQSDVKSSPYVSPDKKKIAYIRDIKNLESPYDRIEIYDTERDSILIFEHPNNRKSYGGHVLYLESWSPDSQYLYYLFSSDSENDHGFGVIDTKSGKSWKLLSGYDVKILGWMDGANLIFTRVPQWKEDVVFRSIDINNLEQDIVGKCGNVWGPVCRYSDIGFPENKTIFYASSNSTQLHMYNFADEDGLLLVDILPGTQYAHSTIRTFSPGKEYMFFDIYVAYTQAQPEEVGTYEYDLGGRSWRHISKDSYDFVLWDKRQSPSRNVLLKLKDQYFLHPTESFDIHPVDVPDKFLEFIN